jgi:putative hydrolase of the HAD superfamily
VISHIFFDFFGTLTRYSEGTEGRAFVRASSWLARRGFEGDGESFRKRWNGVFGRFRNEAVTTHDEFSMEQVVDTFLAEAGIATSKEEQFEFIDLYLHDWNEGVGYLPGLDSLIQRLSTGYSLGVISNTHFEPLVVGHLDRMGISRCLRFVITSVAFGKRKPHPSIFERALEVSGAMRERVLYVGDSYPEDYVGSVGAGIRCLLIDPERRYPIKDEDRLESILELEGVLR